VKATFNLVDRPFTPCLDRDGRLAEYSLLEVFERAPELVEIADPSPLVTVSLYRLLLAILHRLFGPENMDAWERLYKRGSFDTEVIDAYLNQWHTRFDLFDEARPFYQVASLEASKLAPVCKLAHEMASGHNPTLFDHTTDSEALPLSQSEAARLVVATQTYAVGGGVSKPFNFSHAPGLAGVIIFTRGDTLFETLLLNMPLYNRESPMPSHREDLPVWEREAPPEPEHAPPAGYLDYLTWQSRRLRLMPDEGENGNPGIRWVHILQGMAFPKEQTPEDPMMAFTRRKEAGFRAVRLSEGRALWRDSVALFRTAGEDSRPPETIANVARAVRAGILPRERRYDLEAYGLCSDRAKIDFWRRERIPLPLELLADEALVENLRDALIAAENGGRAVWGATRNLAERLMAPEGEGKPDKDAVKSLSRSLGSEARYWASLDLPFRQMLPRLPERPNETLDAWDRTVLGAARRAFELAAEAAGNSARALRAVVNARAALERNLAGITRKQEQP